MSVPIPLPDGVPFTLCCFDCDDEGPRSYDEAVAAGWTQIQFDPDGLTQNYLGYCPECARLNESNDSAGLAT